MKENFMNHPDMKSIPKEKLDLILAFAKQQEGKKPEEILTAMMTFSARLRQQGLSFTKQESNLMIEIMTESMPEEEKQKVRLIKSLLS